MHMHICQRSVRYMHIFPCADALLCTVPAELAKFASNATLCAIMEAPSATSMTLLAAQITGCCDAQFT